MKNLFIAVVFAFHSLTISVSATGSSLWKLPSDTHAVVTGGTKGIGKAVVEELASPSGLGIRVLTCARHQEDLDARIKEWRSAGMDCSGVVADLSSKEGRDDFLKALREWLGRKPLDILGMSIDASMLRFDRPFSLTLSLCPRHCAIGRRLEQSTTWVQTSESLPSTIRTRILSMCCAQTF